MSGEDPPVHERSSITPEVLDAQCDRRWNRRHPIETLKDHESDESAASMGERWIEYEEAQAPQQVVGGEKFARVMSIGEPTAGDGPDDIESSDQRQIRPGLSVTQTVLVCGTDEVGLHQSRRTQAAHGEAAPEEPERSRSSSIVQSIHGVRDGISRHGGRLPVVGGTIRSQADVLGLVSKEQHDDWNH